MKGGDSAVPKGKMRRKTSGMKLPLPRNSPTGVQCSAVSQGVGSSAQVGSGEAWGSRCLVKEGVYLCNECVGRVSRTKGVR